MEQLSNKVTNGGATAAGRLASLEWNQAAKEIEEAIASVGQSLSSGDTEQLVKAIVRFAQGYANWGNDTGAADAYVVNPLFSGFTSLALFAGFTVKFRPANQNATATPTANVFGTGVINIVNEQGGPVSAGDLNTARDAELRYDGTNWRLLDRSVVPLVSGLYPFGYIYGYFYSNSGADLDHDITISFGRCSAAQADLNLDLLSPLNKQIDNVWALGNNLGGRASAVALSNNTWYRVFVIGGISAVTDVGFDTSASATNLLNDATTITGNTYNRYRQIGWIRTDGSANIIPFVQNAIDSEKIYWTVPVSSYNATNPTHDARILVDVLSPPESIAMLTARMRGNSSNLRYYIADIRNPAFPDEQPSDSNFVMHGSNNGSGNVAVSIVGLFENDANSRVALRIRETNASDLANLDVDITTRGFVYKRGIL